MVSSFQETESQVRPLQRTQSILNHPLFAYLTLILLQLKVIWRIWDYKDLSGGDTASYFSYAYNWFANQRVDILWSPAYTTFYGSLLHLVSNVYAATILHRLIIIFITSILMLALMRKLLPHGLAWLVSAWWAVLPINFNTAFEVHLFSVLPLFAASLLVLSKQASWTRGGALAILLASSFLVRNEQLVAATIFSIVCLAWEIWQFVLAKKKPSLRQYVLAYGVPLLLAGVVIMFFLLHSDVGIPSEELSERAEFKHTLNICQIYAFGYQQRHPEWAYNPWTGCQGLMETTFGQQYPSLSEAFRANPPAILQHFWWNISMALNGIQVSLFNATSGSVNPDYFPVTLNAKWTIMPTIAAAVILIAGLVLLWRNRQYWWQNWLKERALGWAVIVSLSAVATFIVIPMQRPRPSYLFSLTILLMASIGMSLFVISHHWFHRWAALYKTKLLAPVLAVALLVAVPSYYTDMGRPLLDSYNQFLPFQNIFERKNTVFLTRAFGYELCFYLGRSPRCRALSYTNDIVAGMPNTTPLETVLAKRKVRLFYADAALLSQLRANPSTTEFLANPESKGWKLLAMQDSASGQWMLFRKLTRKEQQQNISASENI